MERNILENKGIIDVELQAQIGTEKQRWRDVLHRILHCIKFIATQNLALRGHKESLTQLDENNIGNFLGLLKLLANFDPVMKEHLSNVEKNPGTTSYLSPLIQNEFIQLIATSVRQKLLQRIHKAKYFGLMFDSTPDQAHREQMSQTVRYVDIDFQKKVVHVKESFLGFIQLKQKNAESIVEVILNQLEKYQMPLEDCRSQCYDNAAVMAGYKSGIQQRILEKNSKSIFVNCDNHSLNLAGVHAAGHNALMVTFFGAIESLYSFFSRSTLSWQKLKDVIPIVVKSESETRWSSRTDAVKPVHEYFNIIVEVLQNMIDDQNETTDTRSDANLVLNRILTFDFLVLLGFWNKILIRIDRVQKRFQDQTMNFHDDAYDLKALQDYFLSNCEILVKESIEVGLKLCEEWDVEIQRRPRKKKRMPSEKAKDVGLTAKEEIMKDLFVSMTWIQNLDFF